MKNKLLDFVDRHLWQFITAAGTIIICIYSFFGKLDKHDQAIEEFKKYSQEFRKDFSDHIDKQLANEEKINGRLTKIEADVSWMRDLFDRKSRNGWITQRTHDEAISMDTDTN